MYFTELNYIEREMLNTATMYDAVLQISYICHTIYSREVSLCRNQH